MLKGGAAEPPTPNDYRAGLQYYHTTGYLPHPHHFPLIHDKVANALTLMAWIENGCEDCSEPAKMPKAPGMKRWQELLPPALRAKQILDLIAYPGTQSILIQENFVVAWLVAYGFVGEEKDWYQFGLDGLGTPRSVWRRVHRRKS